MEEKYIVYVQTDAQGRITAVDSSAFISGEDWIEIDEGFGDRYHHAQGNYFPLPIITGEGAYRYKLADGVPAECTAEEIEAQLASLEPEPSTEERIAELEAAIDALLGVSE